jgi:hypothetical protein
LYWFIIFIVIFDSLNKIQHKKNQKNKNKLTLDGDDVSSFMTGADSSSLTSGLLVVVVSVAKNKQKKIK